MSIAIIGAGNVGANLGIRLSQSGYDVIFGVRGDKDLTDLLERCDGRARKASVAEAVAGGAVVFLAVPADAAVSALAGMELTGKIVVDCNNPVSWTDGPAWAPPAAGSITAALAEAYPQARCVKGFNTFGAEFHLDPSLGDTVIDVHLASDDAAAKAEVAAIAERAGFSVIDAGGLRNAALLESLAVLWIHLAIAEGRGRFIGFKLLEREQ